MRAFSEKESGCKDKPSRGLDTHHANGQSARVLEFVSGDNLGHIFDDR